MGLKQIWRLGRVEAHLESGAMQMALLFRWLDERRLQARIRAWSAKLLAICGVEHGVSGLPPMKMAGGQLWVANHVSWLDIFALNAVEPVRFVAKAEVARWPLVGYLAKQAGTIFVSREGVCRSGRRQIDEVAMLLQQGRHVVVFPEGTTTRGQTLLPFKSSFFQAALDAQCLVAPVVCRYPQADGSANEAMAYCDDTRLIASLWRILGLSHAQVRIQFLPPVLAEGNRRDFSRHIQAQLTKKLAEPLPQPARQSYVNQAYADLGMC